MSDPIENDNTPTEPTPPLAVVQGQPFAALPKDLYIPPDALEVFLEAFQGPLDLLLYLIRKQNMDILNIPIAEITVQYMAYMELMKEARLELAAEYMVMAAMLAEIKSRMLLPRPTEEVEEDDPRAELMRRLQEYERYREAAGELDNRPRMERDIHVITVIEGGKKMKRAQPNVQLFELLDAFKQVIVRAELYKNHKILREPLSVRERMTGILERINAENFVNFESFFKPDEGRMGLVVTFMAILELMKESLIAVVQQEPFAPIHIKAAV
jgi:segregation and condensation protein A